MSLLWGKTVLRSLENPFLSKCLSEGHILTQIHKEQVNLGVSLSGEVTLKVIYKGSKKSGSVNML